MVYSMHVLDTVIDTNIYVDYVYIHIHTYIYGDIHTDRE